ncbi:hypothetical protein F5Y19DRAFT_474493 [Xylariaceae sp. FL1651]|nr:hypothetical protein F5Y19DRAFT_474493 [Xylariaceae sp. FL1651]
MLSLEHDLRARDVGSNAPNTVILPDTGPSPPGIPYELFIGFLWAGAAVATIFLVGRLYARFHRARRLHLDDFCILFAYILVVTTAALWQYGAKDMYYILNVGAGVVPIGADYVARLRRYLVISCVVQILYYTTLIFFKLSMLFFFKRLGTCVDILKYLWWPILLFSLSTFFVTIGDGEYQCYLGSLHAIEIYCISGRGTSFLRTTLDVNAALDVLSDFLIMLIPIILLWNVQIRWAKKIAIMGIFSLSLVTIAIAIARVVDVGATQLSTGLPNSTYLWFWSSIQSSLCIVVSCSSAFRQLFTASAQSKNKPAWSPTASYYERLKSNFRSRAKKQNNITLYDISTVTKTDNDLDHVMMSEGSELVPHHSSQDFMLVPSEPRPAVACYTSPGLARVSGNQILHEQEYHVTRHPL